MHVTHGYLLALRDLYLNSLITIKHCSSKTVALLYSQNDCLLHINLDVRISNLLKRLCKVYNLGFIHLSFCKPYG